MKRHHQILSTCLVVLLLFLAVPAAGANSSDITIAPTAREVALPEGANQPVTDVVTVPAGATASRVDVYILADTTFSMEDPIDAVKAGASSIVDGLVQAFPNVDLAFGVGDYKDFPLDVYCFGHKASITTDTAAVKAAMAAWSVGGGRDGSEGQFYALDRLARGMAPGGGAIGWREGAKRLIVWMGDAPSHDPICAAISGESYDVTESSLTDRLKAENIIVVAISTVAATAGGSNGDSSEAALAGPELAFTLGLDDDPVLSVYDYEGVCAIGGVAGQGTRISGATGGSYASGIDPASIVNTIRQIIEAQITSINDVHLEPSAEIAPFITSLTPGHYGPLASGVDHTLSYDLTYSGVRAQTDAEQIVNGTLNVIADGTTVTQQAVRIVIPAINAPTPVPTVTPVPAPTHTPGPQPTSTPGPEPTDVPEPGSIILLGMGVASLAAYIRKQKRR